MQDLITTMNEDNQFITYVFLAHGSNILTPQTKQADYSAKKQGNTQINKENMEYNCNR